MRQPRGRRPSGMRARVCGVSSASLWRRAWSVCAWEMNAKLRTTSGSSQMLCPGSETPWSQTTSRVIQKETLRIHGEASESVEISQPDPVPVREEIVRHHNADGSVGLERDADVGDPDLARDARAIPFQQPGLGQAERDRGR